MKDNKFPKITKEKLKGLGGQSYFQNLVINEWGWLYHKIEQENDFGIDAYIEIVSNGNVTGKLIGIQVKYGDSYFSNKRNNRILYHGEQKHLNYYLNSDVPIIIVLINDKFTEIYWKEFKIDNILPNDHGWDIEVPCITIEKEEIEIISKPVYDFTNVIDRIKDMQKLANLTKLNILIISRDDIENLDYTNLLNYIAYLSKNTRILEKKYQSVDIHIHGYDDDPRELYNIPEVMEWFRGSMDYNIPWFYFLTTDDNTAGLLLLFSSAADRIEYDKMNDLYFPLFKNKSYNNFFEHNFMILNDFMERNGLNIELNKKNNW